MFFAVAGPATAVVAALGLASVTTCASETPPPAEAKCGERTIALTGWVVDDAMLIGDAREAALVNRLETLERTTRHQVVVVTLPTLEGRPIEDYSLCLGRTWGIGRKDVNDGVLLVVAPSERKVRIEVGYGLERALRDDEAAAILRETVLPAFGNGAMEDGIDRGVDAIIREIS